MNLLARVARLEREAPAPKLGDCPACSGVTLWPGDEERMGDPDWRPLCVVCGREPAGALKVLPRALLEAL